MSGAKLGAKPIAVAPRPQSAIPARKIRFCPNRSPRAPATNVRAASGRSSAFITHCRSNGDRRISRPIAASATATTALLANTRQLPRLDAASTFVLPSAPTALGSESARPPSVRIRDALLTT